MDPCKTVKFQWITKLKSKRVRRKKIMPGDEANKEYFCDEKKKFKQKYLKRFLITHLVLWMKDILKIKI